MQDICLEPQKSPCGSELDLDLASSDITYTLWLLYQSLPIRLLSLQLKQYVSSENIIPFLPTSKSPTIIANFAFAPGRLNVLLLSTCPGFPPSALPIIVLLPV